MSEHVRKTIADVQEQITGDEQKLAEKKRMVNSLCGLINQPPIYPESSLSGSSSIGPPRPDEYYGQGLSPAMRMVLNRRQLAKQGPATVNEIYDALIAGGYKFTTQVEEHARRGLYSTLTKNTATFHKLPNGSYGLLEWYPGAKEAKAPKSAAGIAGKPADDEADKPFNTDADAEQDSLNAEAEADEKAKAEEEAVAVAAAKKPK